MKSYSVNKIVFSILIGLLSFIGCESTSKKKNDDITEYFIIKRPDLAKIQFNHKTGDTIHSIIDFYFDYNIILIDTINEIYYHGDRVQCMTGYQMNNILPFFAFMNKEYFKKCISIEQVKNIIDKDSSFTSRWIYLVTNRDTINDKRYFSLKKMMLAKNIKISTRLITEEEEAILKAIINNSEYRPEEMEWHSTIGVPDNVTLRNINKNVP